MEYKHVTLAKPLIDEPLPVSPYVEMLELLRKIEQNTRKL